MKKPLKILKKPTSLVLVSVMFVLLGSTPMFGSSNSSKESFYRQHPPVYFLSGRNVPFRLSGASLEINIDGLITTEKTIEYLPFSRSAPRPFQGYLPSSNEIKLQITAIKDGSTILFRQAFHLLPLADNSVHSDIASEPSILHRQTYNIHVEIKYTPVVWWCSLVETAVIPAYEIIVSDFKDITHMVEFDHLAQQLDMQLKAFDELQSNYNNLVKQMEKKEKASARERQVTEATEEARKEQIEFLKRHIPVYLKSESYGIDGLQFKLVFAGIWDNKHPMLPNVEGYDFIGYINQDNQLKEGVIKLMVNENEASADLQLIVPGFKRFDPIIFDLHGKEVPIYKKDEIPDVTDPKMFNFVIETEATELLITGGTEIIKVLRMRLLKPEQVMMVCHDFYTEHDNGRSTITTHQKRCGFPFQRIP